MNREPEILNAKITAVKWENEHCLSHWIMVEGDGWGCGFGGYCLSGPACSMWLEALMDTLELYSFSDATLIGKIVRVESEGWGGQLTALGHPYKNKWMRPRELFAKLEEK
jgi:hypothetical protein